MKKVLSIILSAVMLVSTMAVSTGAFAATKANAPAVKIGTTLSLDIAPVDLEKVSSVMDIENIEDVEKKTGELDVWYAKITPSETGYYEFVFDTEYKCKGIDFKDLLKQSGIDEMELAEEEDLKGSVSGCVASISDSKNNDKGAGMSFNFDLGDEDGESTGDDMLDLLKGLLDMLSIGKKPSFTAKLKEGKTYYLSIINLSSENYKTKLRIAKHKHTLKNVNEKATYKYDKDFEMNWGESGFKGKKCTCGYCEYKKGKTFYAVSDIEIQDTLYTGEKLTPQVVIYLENGKKLNKKFYTVKYTNNKNYGSGKAVIRFKGNYKGKVVERFNIVPKAVGITEVKAKKKTASLKWKKSSEKISGYQIEYGTNKYFSDSKTKNVKGAKNTEFEFKKLKKLGKKYYFRIRTYKVVNGDKYFSAWSKTKKVGKKK